MILLWFVVLAVSLFILIKSADYFTDYAEKIGLYFGLSPFIIGVTIVSIGTSLPELISSLIAILTGNSTIVIGDVIGSNVTNIFLVLGVAVVLTKNFIIDREISDIDLPLLISSSLLLSIFMWDKKIDFVESLILVAGLIVYLIYAVKENYSLNLVSSDIKNSKLSFFVWLGLFLSAFFIYLGAKYTVESVIKLSALLGVGADIISASVVALGTSLPELIVTISSVRKKKYEVAIGNVLGSNIFNALGVVGISGLFGTLLISPNMIFLGIPFLLIATSLFFVMTFVKKVSRWEGLFLILFYVSFIVKLFI